MKEFTGDCPNCSDEYAVSYTDFEYNGDFITVHFICNTCCHEFDVIFDNGKIC